MSIPACLLLFACGRIAAPLTIPMFAAESLKTHKCEINVSREELCRGGTLWYRDHCLELRRSNSVFVWALGDWTPIGVGCSDVTTDNPARRTRTAWGAEFPVPLGADFHNSGLDSRCADGKRAVTWYPRVRVDVPITK